jgi:hypothetical protein
MAALCPLFLSEVTDGIDLSIFGPLPQSGIG